jgi:hypothetical protein
LLHGHQVPFTSLSGDHLALFASAGPQQLIPLLQAVGSPISPSLNPPCSTLFVANLGQLDNEHELEEIFGRYLILQFYKGSPKKSWFPKVFFVQFFRLFSY